jgi:Domain of unknown function (DUF4253)
VAVMSCIACSRLISVSINSQGNPFAKADPERWSTSHSICPGCKCSLCDQCGPPAKQRCGSCNSTLQVSNNEKSTDSGTSKAKIALLTQQRSQSFQETTTAKKLLFGSIVLHAAALLLLGNALFFVLGAIAIAFFSVGLWKLLRNKLIPRVHALLGLCVQIIPIMNILFCCYFWSQAKGYLKNNPDEPNLDEPKVSEVLSNAPAVVQRQASEDDSLDDIAARVSTMLGSPVRLFSTVDFGRGKYHEARSILVPKQGLENLVSSLRKQSVLAKGFIIFGGSDRFLDETDPVYEGKSELVIAKAQSQFGAIRIAQTSPLNHDLNPDKVSLWLLKYHKLFGVDILSASTDSLLFKLLKIPPKGDDFYQELNRFCPDLMQMAFTSLGELEDAIIDGDGWVGLWWD